MGSAGLAVVAAQMWFRKMLSKNAKLRSLCPPGKMCRVMRADRKMNLTTKAPRHEVKNIKTKELKSFLCLSALVVNVLCSSLRSLRLCGSNMWFRRMLSKKNPLMRPMRPPRRGEEGCFFKLWIWNQEKKNVGANLFAHVAE